MNADFEAGAEQLKQDVAAILSNPHLQALRVDARIRRVLELYRTHDGSTVIQGHEYSVDNDGFDVSVSWGDNPVRPDHFLYLMNDYLLFVVKSADELAETRVTIAEALRDPAVLEELTEVLSA
ncbi:MULTISPECIES: hypothetical protein [unclassified Xanthobacter]|uniref:hypothetical protein n=1 Tax=unclassified Xanthobacter TaxID=2623496 RepID=UPI001F2642BE|nr:MULTISPECIES: hypothetical protein [unclassified Xanthobacter]